MRKRVNGRYFEKGAGTGNTADLKNGTCAALPRASY